MGFSTSNPECLLSARSLVACGEAENSVWIGMEGRRDGGREWGRDGWMDVFIRLLCLLITYDSTTFKSTTITRWAPGRPQRTHSWAILAACLGMLPLWGFLNFSGYFLWEDSRYRWHSHHASAEVSAIQVVLDTCGFWCWPQQFEWWNQLVELLFSSQQIGTASEDQLPFFIRPLLDGFCLCVGGRFWSEVWSLSEQGCVLDTECSKMSKLLISSFLDIYTHNIFIIYILYSF